MGGSLQNPLGINIMHEHLSLKVITCMSSGGSRGEGRQLPVLPSPIFWDMLLIWSIKVEIGKNGEKKGAKMVENQARERGGRRPD